MNSMRRSFGSVCIITFSCLFEYVLSVPAATVTVNVGDNFFSPASVTVNQNDTVSWSWIGLNQHSSTSNTGLWDSGIFGRGHTFSREFSAAGNFPYFCRVHPFQTGSVRVQAAANTPPSVTITSPSNNAIFDAPASFTLAASASDPGGSVTQVEFFEGSTTLGIDATSPYSVAVNNLAAGAYSFSAVATDNAGAKATNSVSIVVNAPPANTPPTVSIIAPANGATFAAPFTGTIDATAADNDGSIAKVDFFTGATPLGTVASAPYSLPVSNVAAGAHVLTAVATDNRGAATTSAPVTVSVVTPVPIRLTGAQWLSATQFQFDYTANAGLRYVVERSANLTSWAPINTNTAASDSVSFTDNAAEGALNFYRVGRLPNP